GGARRNARGADAGGNSVGRVAVGHTTGRGVDRARRGHARAGARPERESARGGERGRSTPSERGAARTAGAAERDAHGRESALGGIDVRQAATRAGQPGCVIRLAVRVRREQAELVLAELLELAPAGVEESQAGEDTVEYAVYGAPGELPGLPDLKAAAGDALVEISTSETADDWQERWKRFHRPVLVEAPRSRPGSNRRVPAINVRPSWESASATCQRSI